MKFGEQAYIWSPLKTQLFFADKISVGFQDIEKHREEVLLYCILQRKGQKSWDAEQLQHCASLLLILILVAGP